jgi:hypothetical protein
MVNLPKLGFPPILREKRYRKGVATLKAKGTVVSGTVHR